MQVLGVMENLDKRFEDDVTMEALMNDAPDDVESGKISEGEVVSVDADYVYVNIGGKTEGRVPRSEFEQLPETGAKIEVFLRSRKTTDGMFSLSYRMAQMIGKWSKFSEWYDKEKVQTVKGRIDRLTATGAVVDFGVYTGFLPKSAAADINFKRAQQDKTEYEMRILKIDEKKKSVLLSRRAFVEEIREKAWEKIVTAYKIGDEIEGTVVRLVEFGAFVDIGGFEALLHNNDLTWRKVYKRKEIVKIGDTKRFKILNINTDDKKIALSLKLMKEDPWKGVETKYPDAAVIDGVVTTVTNFGLFVELEEGVEGFVASEELQWLKKAANPKSLYKAHDAVKVKVLSKNLEERSIVLSIKATMENPWNKIAGDFPVSSVHSGVIKSVVKFGIFVSLTPTIDGFIHISDITWDDSVKNPLAGYKEGDTISFKILSVNKQEMKISCGIKQLEKSPWDEIRERFPVRSRVKGTVSSVKPFGVFVKLDENVEGLVHVSEISRNKLETAEGLYAIGDPVEVVVLGVDVAKKKISLSIKHLEIQSEKEEMKKILDVKGTNTATIGDLIKLKVEDKDTQA